MKYMQCTTCKRTAQMNETGTCLQCQGFLNEPQKDIWQKKPVQLCTMLETEYEKKLREAKDEI